MALVLKDRVQETTTTTGTGTLTLGGAVLGFQTFAVIGNTNTTYYTISSNTSAEWEVGIGTYTASGTTLSRGTVLSSSNAGSLVNFSAGTKNVYCTQPSSRAVYADGTTLTAANSSILPLTSGGTAATSASAARTSLGLVIGTDVLAPNGSGASLTSLNATNISSGTLALARLPTGTVLQVVQTVKSDTFSSSSGTFVDITGMSVTITPTSASSKIFVDLVMTCGAPAVTPRFLVLRGSTSIGIGDANGSRQRASFGTGWSGDVNQMTNMSWKFLDSPATTSATTYKVQGLTDGSTFFINRASSYPDNATLGISVISTITAWEIAA